MKFFVPENQVSWCAFPFLALLVRQPTGRILTSAPLKSFWPRRRLQWRSSGLDWRTCRCWFWYLSWSWYLYQKLSWQSFESDIQGKCTDIESICCSTGLRSRGNSKHPRSLWSGRRPGWHGRGLSCKRLQSARQSHVYLDWVDDIFVNYAHRPPLPQAMTFCNFKEILLPTWWMVSNAHAMHRNRTGLLILLTSLLCIISVDILKRTKKKNLSQQRARRLPPRISLPLLLLPASPQLPVSLVCL